MSAFFSRQGIIWCCTPQHGPHFGGLWEAAVKSFKDNLWQIVGNVKFTFEELTTVCIQTEACLNSRPLTLLPQSEDDAEVLTPGHFLIGAPLKALPDSRDHLGHSPRYFTGTSDRCSYLIFGNVGPRNTCWFSTVHLVAKSISQLASRKCCLHRRWASFTYQMATRNYWESQPGRRCASMSGHHTHG